MSKEVNGWLFPEDVDPADGAWYKIPFGDEDHRDLSWYGHIDMAHQVGLEALDTEIVDSGVHEGIRYAAVKTTVVIDGESYSSLGGADEATQQVRDPDHVWSVAESRSVKRAVKKALGIQPAEEGLTEAVEDDATQSGTGGNIEVGPDGDVDVTPPPDYETDVESGW